MQKVNIVIGVMASGKTTYSKMQAELCGYEYIHLDTWYSDRFKGEFELFLAWLREKVESSKKELIIDGWFAWDEKIVHSKEKLAETLKDVAEVSWICLFAPRWVVEDRYKMRLLKDVDLGMDVSFRRQKEGMPENCKFINTMDFSYDEMTKEEYEKGMADEVTQAGVENLIIKYIRGKERYQNIQLPFGFSTGGYTDCERSWEQIKNLDWKDKTVLDIGCHWGYFCFEAKGVGATEVVGMDVSEDAIGIAKRIRDLKRLNVIFKNGDIDEDDVRREYDVILLLNTLHHLRHPFHALTRIFKKGKSVVLEVELPHDSYMRDKPAMEMGDPIKLSRGCMGGHLRFSKEMLIRVAAENGHELEGEIESKRSNRTILVFRRFV